MNKAIVVDSAMALIEQIAHRPGALLNDIEDEKHDLSEWHNVAPMRIENLVIKPFSVGQVVTEGGFECTLQMEVKTERSKGSYMEETEYRTSLTPNAEKMVRQSNPRIARQLLRTCIFRAVFAKLSHADRKRLMAEVRDGGFKGLSDDEAELFEKTGYRSHRELAAAVRADNWIVGGYLEEDDGDWERMLGS